MTWQSALTSAAVAMGLLFAGGIFWAVLRQGIALERLVEVLRHEREPRRQRRMIGFNSVVRPSPPPSEERLRPRA